MNGNYLLALIAKRKNDLIELDKRLKSDKIDVQSYNNLRNRYEGAIDDLYMCLTANDNPLSYILPREEEEKEEKKKKKK